jgi:hypothetical protein
MAMKVSNDGDYMDLYDAVSFPFHLVRSKDLQVVRNRMIRTLCTLFKLPFPISATAAITLPMEHPVINIGDSGKRPQLSRAFARLTC